MTILVFGSSLSTEGNLWQVWCYDAEENGIGPIAAFEDEQRCRRAAFELAHSAAKFEDPTASESILANGKASTKGFTVMESDLLRSLANDAILHSTEPEPGKVTISIRSTDLDKVFVVRYRAN